MEGEQGEGWPWKKLLLVGGGALLLSGGLYLSYRFVRNYLRSNEVQTLLRMRNYLFFTLIYFMVNQRNGESIRKHRGLCSSVDVYVGVD